MPGISGIVPASGARLLRFAPRFGGPLEAPGPRAGSEDALAEARSLLSAIQREVDRLTEVTESYLQYARLPRPRLEEDELGPVIEGGGSGGNMDVLLVAVKRDKISEYTSAITQAGRNASIASVSAARNARTGLDSSSSSRRVTTRSRNSGLSLNFGPPQ